MAIIEQKSGIQMDANTITIVGLILTFLASVVKQYFDARKEASAFDNAQVVSKQKRDWDLEDRTRSIETFKLAGEAANKAGEAAAQSSEAAIQSKEAAAVANHVNDKIRDLHEHQLATEQIATKVNEGLKAQTDVIKDTGDDSNTRIKGIEAKIP